MSKYINELIRTIFTNQNSRTSVPKNQLPGATPCTLVRAPSMLFKSSLGSTKDNMGAESTPETKKCPRLYENAGPFCVKQYHIISTFNTSQTMCQNDGATLIKFGSLNESQTVDEYLENKLGKGSWYWTAMKMGTFKIIFQKKYPFRLCRGIKNRL